MYISSTNRTSARLTDAYASPLERIESNRIAHEHLNALADEKGWEAMEERVTNWLTRRRKISVGGYPNAIDGDRGRDVGG